VRGLSAEELVTWFGLLGEDYKQYGMLLEGTNGKQLGEAMDKGNLRDFIVNEDHCQVLERELKSPNMELIRRAKGGAAPAITPKDNYRAYKARLTALLTARSPNMLRTLDVLLSKFPGKEDQVYKQMCKKFAVEPAGPPTAEEIAALDAPEPAPVKKGDFEVGEDCYCKTIGTDRWLNARITHVNGDNTFDIFVYSAKAHGVAQEAVNVQREFLAKKSENITVAQPPAKKPSRPKFQTGDRVKAFGLRSHTTYNGLCGVVLLYVPSERRYQVRLDTNDVIAIKERNVMAESDQM